MVDNIRKRSCSFLAFLILSAYDVNASVVLAASPNPSSEPEHHNHRSGYVIQGEWPVALHHIFRPPHDTCAIDSVHDSRARCTVRDLRRWVFCMRHWLEVVPSAKANPLHARWQHCCVRAFYSPPEYVGLTLGYMSLDETQLRVLSVSGTEKQREYAQKIQPIRKNGHLLLVRNVSDTYFP